MSEFILSKSTRPCHQILIESHRIQRIIKEDTDMNETQFLFSTQLVQES